jgi:hypothetical protein
VTHVARRQRRLASGFWRHQAMTGYTSPGAGLSSLPVRFNCPPEVTLFVLRRSADPEGRGRTEDRGGRVDVVPLDARPGTF